MSPLAFFVPGEPRAKARPRTVRDPNTGRVRTFTPTRTLSYEHTVKTFAIQAMAKARWPRSTEFDRFDLQIELRLGDRRRKDIDNIEKALMDALQPEIVPDDWQISRKSVVRIMDHPQPGALIVLTRVDELFAA